MDLIRCKQCKTLVSVDDADGEYCHDCIINDTLTYGRSYLEDLLLIQILNDMYDDEMNQLYDEQCAFENDNELDL